jgi:hypothetical protein
MTAPLVCIRVGDPWRVREIAEALENAGVTCRIDTYPPGADVAPQRRGRGAGTATEMGVYVADADAQAAAQIADEHERSRMPEVETEQPEWEGDPGRCPGCGTALEPAAASCAECGLEFPPIVECRWCGSLCEGEAATCIACGRPPAG